MNEAILGKELHQLSDVDLRMYKARRVAEWLGSAQGSELRSAACRLFDKQARTRICPTCGQDIECDHTQIYSHVEKIAAAGCDEFAVASCICRGCEAKAFFIIYARYGQYKFEAMEDAP